jgi:pimeloyl-ACP methyl ester carboxylesterase
LGAYAQHAWRPAVSIRSAVALVAVFTSLALALFGQPAPAHQHPTAEITPSGGTLSWHRLGDQDYYVYLPKKDRKDQPYRLLVSIHGSSRTAQYYAERFIDFADHNRYVVVAPYFPDPMRFQDLGIGVSVYRADLRLLEIVSEVRRELPVEEGPFDLFGFSGGGQFAHRFLYLHPEVLRTVVVGAPGTVALPFHSERWPYGVGDLEELAGQPFSLDAVKRRRIKLLIGERDLTWDNLNVTDEAMRFGPTRLGRLRTLHEAWLQAGIPHEYEELGGVGHEVDGPILDAAKAFLTPRYDGGPAARN